MFSNGAEVAWVVPPRAPRGDAHHRRRPTLAACSSRRPRRVRAAEAAQASNGAGNGRFADRVRRALPDGRWSTDRDAYAVVVVTDDARGRVRGAGGARRPGREGVGIGSDPPATDFAGASEQLTRPPTRPGPSMRSWSRAPAPGRAAPAEGWEARARRARRNRRRDPERRGVGAGGQRPRPCVEPADADRHRGRRHDGRRAEPGPGRPRSSRVPRTP